MSTKLTRKSPLAGYTLVESHALAMAQATEGFRGRMVAWLLARLHEEGFPGLKAGQLSFLGALDCGENHAASLARTLGISRQAVHKTVRELEVAGWLATRPDEKLGNQRVIVFTAEGERMMARAREHFQSLDRLLLAEFGATALEQVHRVLAFSPTALPPGP